MTTIVNNPAPKTESNGFPGVIVGVFAVLVFAYLFMTFALPAIRNIQVPPTQINIPEKINVNIEQTK